MPVSRNGQGGHPARDPNVERLLKSGAGLTLERQQEVPRTHRQITFQGCHTTIQPIVDQSMTVVGYQLLIRDLGENVEYVLPFNMDVKGVWCQILEALPAIGTTINAEEAQMTIEDVLADPEDPLADRFLVSNNPSEPIPDFAEGIGHLDEPEGMPTDSAMDRINDGQETA